MVAGDWHSSIHEEPVARALEQLGHAVVRFPWHSYFKGMGQGLDRIRGISYRIQRRYLFGPRCIRLNEDLAQLAIRERPDVLFVYRGTHVTLRTLQRIRLLTPNTLFVGYNNDDPFSPRYPSWMWRHFRSCLPEYDLALAYRYHNVEEFHRAGARRAMVWRSWFVPELNHPCVLSAEERQVYECDAVFVGHYEADKRISYLEAVARKGHRLRVYGPDYPKQLDSPYLRGLPPILPVRGEDYNKALCGAKIALCFLSMLNRDTYTRRNFEIPATKTMMLSEYSDDLATLFVEGRDAAFFRTEEELVSKMAFYLNNDSERESIVEGGHRRVWTDGHDVMSRVKQLMEWISDLKG